eukprot:15439828-Alexandrium_andersonii.AAC.1
MRLECVDGDMSGRALLGRPRQVGQNVKENVQRVIASDPGEPGRRRARVWLGKHHRLRFLPRRLAHGRRLCLP